MGINWKSGAVALVAIGALAMGAACEAPEKTADAKPAEAAATSVPLTATTEKPTTTSTTSTSTTTTAPPTTTTTPPPPPPPPPTTQAYVPPAPKYEAPPSGGGSGCDPNYTGCVPIASDVDCAGGSGNGPAYTGYVRVIGSDIYDLDSDHDGEACE
jgi:hypothetical protein